VFQVRRATVALGIGAVAAVVVLLVFACAAACAAESSGTPVSTRSEAVALASAYTGLSAETAASAARREVTDASAPVFEIRERAVWEVVFEGVRISVPDREGGERENPNIDAVSVWIDAQTGVLVKAFAPKPAEGGLERKIGDRERAHLLGNGLILSELSTPPAKALMSALAFAKATMRGYVPEAKEIVAYYGLLTDERDVERKWVDRPAWFIYLGGISQPFPGGPIGSTPLAPATQALVVLDATTGERHRAFFDG
jgi:hypothetical protein